MLEAIGVPHSDNYLRHCCANEKHSWPPLPRKEWEAHLDDKCACKNPHNKRFEKVRLPNGKHMVRPVKPFFYHPIEEGIRGLNSQPAFAQARGKGHDSGFYTSPEADRVDAATGGALAQNCNSAFIEGYDGLQVQGLVDRSTFVGLYK
eukprot:GHUV01053299.1.p1 GENE.GHUV01053299.1~~GHUV01053299.1.p1  ORF type:complete len:148 (+),score=33.82 GHUV01053299.1:484-927(+)